MCNAKSLRYVRDEMVAFAQELGLQLANDYPPFEPRYRIGPTQQHTIFRPSDGEQVSVDHARWDLIPSGNAKRFLRTNARAEGLRTTWPWKLLYRSQRCQVPADGFYDPEKPARAKGTVPWSFYSLKNGGPFMMAGLYNRTPHLDGGEPLLSYTIITTTANEAIRIHDRMPVMITEPEAMREWLFADDLPEHLLVPFPAERMAGWRVVDEARNSRAPEHPGMVEPVESLL